MTELIQRATIDEVVGHRAAALQLMTEAAQMMEDALKVAQAAHAAAERAHAGAVFVSTDRAGRPEYRRLFEGIDVQRSLTTFRHYLDSRCWNRLLVLTGMHHLMDAQARREFEAQLAGDDVPEVTVDNARMTLETIFGDRHRIFRRGLAEAFSELDRRFKSHDGFKIGSRIILTRLVDADGFFSRHNTGNPALRALEDVERIFGVLDGQPPQIGALADAIAQSRSGGWGARQSVVESDFFRVRIFKNGNAHLWMRRDDLVERVNLELAAWYGEVLPDGVPPDVNADDLRGRSTALRTSLQFYATPPAAAAALLREVYLPAGARVLEPSAGDGALLRAVSQRAVADPRQRGLRVDAVEVDPGRVATLRGLRLPGVALHVQPANFLTWPVQPVYDAVLMNPPFHGTGWAQHVMHAFDAVKPGGSLHAILPITAETGTSKAHDAFRAWATQHSRWSELRFEDLPPGSFAESGTNVNTVILRLYKGRA